MKRSLVLVAACCLVASLLADALRINHVSWYFKTTSDFICIEERFDPEGGERFGERHIVRTDADVRKGYYFALRLNHDLSHAPKLHQVVVDYIAKDKGNRPLTHTFALPDVLPDKQELWIGLTGEAEPADQTPLTAWRIRLFDTDGELIDERKSFLWSN